MIKLFSSVLSASLLLLLVACEKSQSAASAVTDPLASFKVIAERCQAAVVDSDKTWPGMHGGIGRTVITTRDTGFDVSKTDSLVSPFTAYIKLNFLEEVSVADTEGALHNPGISVVRTENHWRLNYAFQDGKWQLQNALYAFELPEVNVKKLVPEEAEVDTLIKRVPDAAACVPA